MGPHVIVVTQTFPESTSKCLTTSPDRSSLKMAGRLRTFRRCGLFHQAWGRSAERDVVATGTQSQLTLANMKVCGCPASRPPLAESDNRRLGDLIANPSKWLPGTPPASIIIVRCVGLRHG